MGIYSDSSGRPGNVIIDAGTASITSTGIKTTSFTAVTLTPGWYWAILIPQSLDTAGANPTFAAASAHNNVVGETLLPQAII